MKNIDANFPTILVIFGATGDLMEKKIVPALFDLYWQKKLPALFHIIGFSRRDYSAGQFQDHIAGIILRYAGLVVPTEEVKNFIKLFAFRRGRFEAVARYEELARHLGRVDGEWKTCANKLFYLAVPPEHDKIILENLSSAKLTLPCSQEEGWTRVIVEKPFGKDFKTAQDLDRTLGRLFKEIQIYRLDHYLAKEMLEEIMNFRFANNLFEDHWSNRSIESIVLRLYEKIGVETRGAFYDGVGALRDVGQNHLLQMLALITMDAPASLSASAIREKRAAVLRTLAAPTFADIKKTARRAQYAGYTAIPEVNPMSTTETFFRVEAKLAGERWRGVKIFLESGKRLGEQRKEAVITFNHPHPCLCPPGGRHFNNQVIISLEPEEKILITFRAKKPGLELALEERSFNFMLRESKEQAQYVEQYAKLLFDCIKGDQTLFVSTSEIDAMWKFIDPISRAWQKNASPLLSYAPDSADIAERVLEVSGQPFIAKTIGIIGLGKMGANLARHLNEEGWKAAIYDRSPESVKELAKEGPNGAFSLAELIDKLPQQKIIWLMLPAGKAVDETLFGPNGIAKKMKRGDIIIDGGNSYFKDTIRRAQKLAKQGIHLLDCGTSGGPSGARDGACLMIGGEKKIFEKLEVLFDDLAVPGGYQFFPGAGAGHFVKMIHNGIEYGILQAIAEGFSILKKSAFKLNLAEVASIYNHGSVIESRLIAWLKKAFELYGANLRVISGQVSGTGEGAWTVKTAAELKVTDKIIAGALRFREVSRKKPDYTGKIISALRQQFGGHSVKL